MNIPCKHWSECGLERGGCCAQGQFGGKPTFRNCVVNCTIYEGPIITDEMKTEVVSLSKGVEKKPCKKCGQPAVERWMGILWYGLPWPKRIRIQWPMRIDKGRGCGCMVWAKSLTLALKGARMQWCQIWTQAREAHQQVQEPPEDAPGDVPEPEVATATEAEPVAS